MTTSPPNTTTNTTAANTPVDLVQFMGQQVVNPYLGPTTELTPVLQETDEQFLQDSGQLLQNNQQTQIQQQQQQPIPQVQATQTDAQQPLAQIDQTKTNIEASKVDAEAAAAQGQAEQMQISELATVQGQLAKLYDEMDKEGIPKWAQASVAVTNEVLAARGLKPNSSIGYTALQGAVQQQAINIAAADASAYFQVDMANFNARQQTNLQNIQFRQQAMLTNTAAENAAKQFNAQNEQQTQQFMANLVASINESNASRIQAAELANQSTEAAMQQFYQAQEFNRQKFNAENQFAIDQSNVLWRRQLNTANTAAINAANQFNVQNAYNLSVTALNNLWQQFRDEASWAFEAAENEKNRNYNLALAANNQSFIANQSEVEWYEQLGGFASALLFS